LWFSCLVDLLWFLFVLLLLLWIVNRWKSFRTNLKAYHSVCDVIFRKLADS
jgi:hypothetical protein